MTQLLSGPQQFFRREILPILADLRLAILLLLAIALFSISGTVIEQDQSLEFYQANYPEDPALFGFLSWKVLLLIGLDHVYSTWWFLALLILFGSSLTACTFTRQLPALKAARNWKFYQKPRQFEKLALSTALDAVPLDQAAAALSQQNFKVFQDDNAIYARKGMVGRIGPVVVHASMLLILAGCIWGSMTGFMAQEMIPDGTTTKIGHIIKVGPWAVNRIPQDWAIKVNRFWIDYTPDGNIDQFYSDLSVVDDQGNEADRQTIHVNKPFKYHGVTMYQADWAVAGLEVQLNNSPVLGLPMSQLKSAVNGRLWATWVPTNPDMSSGVAVVAQDLQGTVLVYGAKGELIGTVRAGQSIEVNDINLKIVDVVGSTGLQIKADPGIPIIYAGFGLLMLSAIMSYFSHSQVWVLLDQGVLYIGGRTNRAQVTFERDFIDIVEQLEASAHEPIVTAPVEVEPVSS